MKKIIATAFISFMILEAYCQPIDSHYPITKLERYYNNTQFDSIWHLFSKDMQNYLPLEKTHEYSNGGKMLL